MVTVIRVGLGTTLLRWQNSAEATGYFVSLYGVVGCGRYAQPTGLCVWRVSNTATFAPRHVAWLNLTCFPVVLVAGMVLRT